MQQINFTGNLGRDGNTTMFFNTKEAKEMILEFFTRMSESIVIFFCFNKRSRVLSSYL